MTDIAKTIIRFDTYCQIKTQKCKLPRLENFGSINDYSRQ